MKKLSISLFAVLAIVFAVSSAFTTAKKVTKDFRIFEYTQADQEEAFQSNGHWNSLESYIGDTPLTTPPEACDGGDVVCAVDLYIDLGVGEIQQEDFAATITELEGTGPADLTVYFKE
jgi:hypothetical protein